MSLPPGPTTPRLLQTYRWMRDPYHFQDQLTARYGPTFTVRFAGFPRLVLFSRPEDVREIFADGGESLSAGRFNRMLAPLLGDRSVLMVDGPEHRRKRKLLLPPLRGERMEAYGETMQREANQALRAMPRGAAFALHEPMQEATLRIIARTIFGFDRGERAEEMLRRTRQVLELGSWPPLLLPPLQRDLGAWSPYGRFRRALADGDELLYEEIRERRRTGSRGSDILSLLLDARDDEGKPMSENELRDELVTLLVAGHETTATALTWAIRWLLDAPEALSRLRSELDALGPSPSAKAIAAAPWLDATVREALRLVPIIPIVGRILDKPRTVGGYALPADTPIGCSIYLAHRREEAFPRAAQFDPSRFLNRKVSAHEFFPFGGGIRRCIGMGFALYEMKMMLAALVTRLELRLDRPGPVEYVRRSVTITPKNGLRVVVNDRAPTTTQRAA